MRLVIVFGRKSWNQCDKIQLDTKVHNFVCMPILCHSAGSQSCRRLLVSAELWLPSHGGTKIYNRA